MRTEYRRDIDGKEHPFLVPENERERRELAARTDLADGGIDERDDEGADGDDWSDE